MTEQVVELIQPTPGLAPYVLVETEPDETAPQGFHLKVRAGGGVSSGDEIAALLLLVVENITGVPTDSYAREVDEAFRRRGGKEATDVQ